MQMSKAGDKIECPSCRAQTDLSASGISGLQTNFYISFVQGLIKKLGLSECCSKHSLQPMSFFCQKCSTTVCRDCLVLEHRESEGHRIQDMSKATTAQREELSSGLNAAQRLLANSMSRLISLQAEVCNLTTAKEAVLRGIDMAFKKYMATLLERHQQLHKIILDAYEYEANAISNITSGLKKYIECLKQILAKSNLVLQHGSMSDIINTKQKLASITLEIAERVNGTNVGKNNFTFDAISGVHDFEASIQSLGQITQTTALPSSFQFYGTEDLTACIPAKITVTVSACDGEKLANIAALDFIVTDKIKTLIPSLLACCTDAQSYSLSFEPQISGDHWIVPTFHDQPIQESLHKVTVNSNNPVAIYGGCGEGRGTFRSPRALALDKSGNIYVADTGNRLIQKLDKNGRFLHQFKINSGNEDCSTCDLALLPDEESIVCIETLVGTGAHPSAGNTVAIYTVDGRLKYKFTNTDMRCALCLATNNHSEIIISDYLVHSLFVYKANGEHIRTIGNAGCFNHPAFICVGQNDMIFVTDTNNNSVLQFDQNGRLIQHFGVKGFSKGELFQPFGVVTDGEKILVVDSGNHRIQVFTTTGEFVSMIESLDHPLDQPRGLGLTNDGHVLVADRDNHCIKKFRYK